MRLFPRPSPRSRAFHLLLSCATLALCACRSPEPAPAERRLITAKAAASLAADIDPVQQADAQKLSAVFDERVRLLGVKAPAEVQPGERAALTLYFELLEDLPADPQVKVFVHGRAPGAEVNQVGADHRPLGGASSGAPWRRGDVLVDAFTVVVPRGYPSERLLLHAGLYEGKQRWSVTEGEHDGDDRVLIATLPVKGGGPSELRMTAKKRQGALRIDGVLDEADWQRAERAGPFIAYDGRRKITNPTWVRVLWDADQLYVAFECDDKDIHTPYEERDDPLYESEAVEIFIDADGDKDVYVELQAAPNDVHFDAAFAGGRRKNFDTSYDVNYQTKAKLDGTLNDGSDVDKGWVSEWRIPIAELRDVPAPPAVGSEWKVNFFRLDRLRRGERVVGSEAAAWSSPLSGDFHNLDRFGTLVFGE